MKDYETASEVEGRGSLILLRCGNEQCGARWGLDLELPAPADEAFKRLENARCPCCGEEKNYVGWRKNREKN